MGQEWGYFISKYIILDLTKNLASEKLKMIVQNEAFWLS